MMACDWKMLAANGVGGGGIIGVIWGVMTWLKSRRSSSRT